MLGKFSAVVGPVLLGTVTLVTGNARMGLFALVVNYGLFGWIIPGIF